MSKSKRPFTLIGKMAGPVCPECGYPLISAVCDSDFYLKNVRVRCNACGHEWETNE